MKLKKLVGKIELGKKKKDIEKLFEICHGRELEKRVYEKLYLNPLFSESIGVAGYEQDDLVSFYGLVPQLAVRPQDEKKLRYLLGCTLMVHPEFRNGKNFFELIKESHSAAEEWGADLIMGFPNNNSFKLLIDMCGWNCIHETEILSSYEVEENNNHRVEIKNSSGMKAEGKKFIPPFTSERYAKWRGIGNIYKLKEGSGFVIGYKKYKESVLDIMDVVSKGSDGINSKKLEYIASKEGCEKIFVSRKHVKEEKVSGLSFEKHVRTERMAGVPICLDKIPKIRFNLFMSDVY